MTINGGVSGSALAESGGLAPPPIVREIVINLKGEAPDGQTGEETEEDGGAQPDSLRPFA